MALALLAAAPLTAQDWYLGVEGGLNISDIDAEKEELDSETGLTNINDSPGSDQVDAKNRNIQLSAGYAVRLH